MFIAKCISQSRGKSGVCGAIAPPLGTVGRLGKISQGSYLYSVIAVYIAPIWAPNSSSSTTHISVCIVVVGE